MFTNRLMKIIILILLSILTSFAYSQANIKTGIVVESMDSGGYTYINVNVDGDTVWLAAPITAVAVGDTVHFTDGMLMNVFTSRSLNRTFDEIYFTGSLNVGSKPTPGAEKNFGHANQKDDSKSEMEISKAAIDAIQKIEGGKSIAEIRALKSDSAGKTIKVKGIITKYNGEILSRNWLHLRDASTGLDGDDLVVTTQLEFEVGDVVELEGTLALDKNFGFGYQYAVLLEDAVIIK